MYINQVIIVNMLQLGIKKDIYIGLQEDVNTSFIEKSL